MKCIERAGQLQRFTLRGVARHLALSGLALSWRLSGRLSEALSRPRVHFLYLHHVFPDELRGFRGLVEMLQASGQTFVSYSEAVDRVRQGRFDAPCVCFSFDDGIANNLDAAEVLSAHGISACFFLNSGIVGEASADKVAEHCRVRFNGSAPHRFLDWDDVSRLMAAGHEIGGHTRSHVNMAQTPDAELREEIERDRETLAAHCGEIRHFSWPYGRFGHFSLAAREMVYAAGYESIASAVRGCHVEQAAQPCLRRENLQANWPVAHAAFFMARSAMNAGAADNGWGPLEAATDSIKGSQ